MVGNFAKGFASGIQAPLRGARFLKQHPGLIVWCVIPVLLNYLVFIGLGILTSRFIPEITTMVLPEATNWFWTAIHYLFQGVGYLVVGVVVYFLFVPMAGLLASPFNDMLAEQVGILVTGHKPDGAGWANFAKDAVFSVMVELKKLSLLGALLGSAFILSFIPVVQILAGPIAIVIGVFYVALEYIDFTMSHRKLSFSDRVALLAADEPGLAIGFGLPPYVIALIPVVNALVIPPLAPVMVVAGALIYYEKLAPQTGAATDTAE